MLLHGHRKSTTGGVSSVHGATDTRFFGQISDSAGEEVPEVQR